MKNDPRGYYSVLGLTSSASINEIKKAYKNKAHELHPDKNHGQDTTRQFQFLNDAYEVLSDPEKRTKYDSESYRQTNTSGRIEPIKCSCCHKITAQPRYIIFYEIKSFMVVTTQTPIQGIFCPQCADKKVIKPTIITWLLGWWGFPWGPFFSLHAIFVNLFGGKKPKEINGNILQYQAAYFAQQGQYDIANSLIQDARKLSTSSKQKEELKTFQQWLKQTTGKTEFQTLKNKWQLFSRSFLIQLIFVLVFIFTILGLILNSLYQSKQKELADAKVALEYAKQHPVLPLPKTGDIFISPPASKYMAPFSVSTSGDGHTFIKLTDVKTQNTVLEMFIRTGEIIETKIPLGTYVLHYANGYEWYGRKDLFGKDTQTSEADTLFTFEKQGHDLIGNTVELILQRDGNLPTHQIPLENF